MTPHPPIHSEPRLAPSVLLGEKLAALRRKQAGVAAGTGAGMAVGALVILLGLAMLLDWWLDCPLGARALALLLTLGVTAALVWRFILTPIRRPPDDDAVALTVEKAHPEFRSRLISSVQFARAGTLPPGTAVSLARMTIAETEELARPLDFNAIISTKELGQVLTWAVAVLALGLFAFMYGGDVSRDLFKRAFLSSTPVPRHTRVFMLTEEKRIGRGDPFRVEAVARGVTPKTGRLIVKAPGRRTQEYTMEQDKEGRFTRTLENVQQSFSYTVRLNDGASEAQSVEVVPRPTTVSIECDQTFPAYTRLPRTKRPLGDLTLLAGSKVQLNVVATRDLKQAFIRLAGLSNDVPMRVDAKNPRALQGEFTIPTKGLTGFSIEMLDTSGMASRDAAIYRIDVIPDRVPKVRVTYPERREELVTRQAVQPVAFETSDDFRIVNARLRYRVGESEEGEIKTVELETGTNAIKELRGVYQWNIRDFQPPLLEGTRLEFWVEVEDNNDVTGPGLGRTEHQLLRVVSENDKRADLLNRAGDFIGTIGDVAGDQEKLNSNLGVLLRPKGR